MAAARSSSTPTVSPAAMARSAGRLAAVQALYQIEVSDLTSDSVLKDFISGRQGGMAIVEDPETAQEQFIELCEADSGLLVDIVRVVDVRGEEVDAMMTNSLSLDWLFRYLFLIQLKFPALDTSLWRGYKHCCCLT